MKGGFSLSSIRESKLFVHGEPVTTYSISVHKRNVSMLVEVGSSGFDGIDGWSSSGRTYVGLLCDSAAVSFDSLLDKRGKIVGVEISGCGDAVLDALIDALNFVVVTLRDERGIYE